MLSKLIFFLLLYLLYRTAKSWSQKNFSKNGGENGAGKESPADLMVQDPFCKVYFPKREGVCLEREGSTIFFCSETCKNKYLLAQQQKNK